ncbi:MAG: metal ABC transporter ATP-binding protein [Chloroflexi bacterium]|nr:metal ABC transporter ATP-binding protein [Chloroflexota bacterium]
MTDGQAPAVAFEGVTFGYGPTIAVEDITFSIARGDFVALIGPNGSGKTTLIKLAIGLEQPQRGRVFLFGQEVNRFKGWRRVGYIPQYASAFRVRFPATVGDVVAQGAYTGLDPLALFRTRIAEPVEDALHMVGMWDLRGRLISELSVGQQQRVLVARALVRQPELLILDEPTSGVDKSGQEQFYTLLRRLRETRGTTVVLVSHDVGVVLHEANKVACINCRLQSYTNAKEVTDGDLSRLYGHSVDLVIHRHD